MIEYVATCLFGLESLLGEEIEALGYSRTETIDGRITFTGDAAAASRCNIGLRFAERVFVKLGSFSAESFDALFEGTKALPWENYIGSEDSFPVKGHSIRSALTSIPDCQSIVKKAVVTSLSQVYRKSWFEETGIKYQIEFFILNNKATLMIDLSGQPLHKRGYRPEASLAPLRETLAAALAKISRPREDVLFWDPMCGSGTIPIEAAMIMTNTAPGLKRSFAAESFPAFPQKLWVAAREEATSNIKETAFEAYASDIDMSCVELTRNNIHRAGMGKYIKAFQRNALEITTGGRRGTIVCNPPYGERLMTVPECEELYRKMGNRFATLDSWQIYIISSNENFERFYGQRADKVRRLYNGMIKCGYYQYFKKKQF